MIPSEFESLKETLKSLHNQYSGYFYICDMPDGWINSIGLRFKYKNTEKSWNFNSADQIEESKEKFKDIIECIDLLKWKVILVKDSTCAYDDHEMFNYPREGFKPKPKLSKGTILKVTSKWENLYGEFYSCKTDAGIYDIPVENAKYYSGIVM